MEVTPIYLTNIDLALQMREAGFNKDCVHHANTKGYIFSSSINVYAYETWIRQIQNENDYTFHKLALPTLGEIELPVGYSVVKNANDEWYISYYDEPYHNHTLNTYKTELEARCHAWLWANKKEVDNGNN